MIIRIYTEEDLIRFIENDEAMGEICDSSILYHYMKDNDFSASYEDIKIYRYKNYDVHIKVLTEVTRIYLISKTFTKIADADFIRSPVMLKYSIDRKEWIRKVFDYTNHNTPIEIMRNDDSIEFEFPSNCEFPSNKDKLAFLWVMVDRQSRYITNIGFYKGDKRIGHLRALIPSYGELDFVFKIQVPDENTFNLDSEEIQKALNMVDLITI